MEGGRDFKLLSALSRHLNFSINFTHVSYIGFAYDNGSSDGSMKLMINDEVDMTICDWWLTRNRLEFIDATSPYYSDHISFVIPPGRELSSFEKLVYPFSFFVWISVVACFLIGAVTVCVVKRRSRFIRNFVFGTDVQTPHLNLLIGFIGGVQTLMPKRNFARFLLMTFLMYSLVMRTLYQGSFYKLMQSNERHKTVETIDEMIKENFWFYIPPGVTDMVRDIDGFRNRFNLLGFTKIELNTNL